MAAATRFATSNTGGSVPQGSGYFRGARLLATDLRVTLMLLKEARYRAFERVFGIPRDKQAVVMLIALGMAVQAAHAKAKQMASLPPSPTRSDAVIGGSLIDETVHLIAGDWSRESPLFGTLVAIALAGALTRPVVRASADGVRRGAHLLRHDFDRRYGHLIRRNLPARMSSARDSSGAVA